MRRLGRRFLALPPLAQNALTIVALLAACAAVDMVTGFGDGWPWWLNIITGVVAGWTIGRIGRYVGEVAQAKFDLASDAEAMRDAINRLERGDR